MSIEQINFSELNEMKSNLLESTELSPETIEAIFSECDFTVHNWEGLNDLGKMRELQGLEDNLANIEGREPVEVIPEKPSFLEKFRSWITGGVTMGYYDPSTNKIYINSDLLKDPQGSKALVDTIAHEGIHAYQNACINGEASHHNPVEVEQWRENFKNYLSADIYGYEMYRNQPVEVIAFDKGELVSNSYKYA